MFLVGSTLTSWDPGRGVPTPRSKDEWLDFNAFYVGWSGSETYVADAHVNGLGYGNGKSYGFVLSSGPENVLRATSNAVPKPTGIIVDSLFTDMYYGFYTYDAEDVSVIGNTYSNSTIYAIDPHDWSEKLTFAYNTTLDTHVKHGIVTSREVRHSYIVGNITSGNAGSGILLDRTSNDNVIAYNLSIGNRGDGLTLYESSCNLVYRNTFVGNHRAGVRIRNSSDVLLVDNAVSDNVDAGLSAYTAKLEDDPRHANRDFAMDPYNAYTDFSAVRNAITGNGGGAVEADEVSAMVLAGNRLSGDADTILKGFGLGDAGPQVLSLASRGVVVRDACRPVRPTASCAFRDGGEVGDDPVGSIEAVGQGLTATCAPDLADASGPPAMYFVARSK
jgi:poly(beta-D-mannuronate) C5 epimerase